MDDRNDRPPTGGQPPRQVGGAIGAATQKIQKTQPSFGSPARAARKPDKAARAAVTRRRTVVRQQALFPTGRVLLGRRSLSLWIMMQSLNAGICIPPACLPPNGATGRGASPRNGQGLPKIALTQGAGGPPKNLEGKNS